MSDYNVFFQLVRFIVSFILDFLTGLDRKV